MAIGDCSLTARGLAELRRDQKKQKVWSIFFCIVRKAQENSLEPQAYDLPHNSPNKRCLTRREVIEQTPGILTSSMPECVGDPISSKRAKMMADPNARPQTDQAV